MNDRLRERFVDEYLAAVKAYTESVGRLRTALGAEFDHAYKLVKEAHARCESCRAAFLDAEKEFTS